MRFFYVPLPTIENVEICWKRRKIGHYRAVQFSEREAVSISPKQSVVGSTPTGLNPQTSNSFWLMFSRASCQTREEHRLERFFFCPEICFLRRCWRCWQLPNISPFCQQRCYGKRAICLTFACTACQQFSALRIFGIICMTLWIFNR